MITYIRIGGKQRPVCFGHQVAYDYEFNTGRNYNALLMKVSDMFFQSAAAVAGPDGAADMEIDEVAILMSEERKKAITEFSVVPLTDLVYYGMLYAHRREGIEVDFEAADVAGWVFDDQSAMTDCLRLMMASLPQNKDAAGAKKKTTNPTAKPAAAASRKPSTGRTSSKPRR